MSGLVRLSQAKTFIKKQGIQTAHLEADNKTASNTKYTVGAGATVTVGTDTGGWPLDTKRQTANLHTSSSEHNYCNRRAGDVNLSFKEALLEFIMRFS